MKRIEKYNTIVEEYQSIEEFTATLATRKTNDAFNGSALSSKKSASDSWDSGYKTVEQALETLKDGSYKKGLKKLKATKKAVECNATQTKVKRYADLVGYSPIVPAYLQGLPQAMVNSKRVVKKSKVLKVAVCVSYAWYVETREILDHACKVLSDIITLEKQGYRIDLYAFDTALKDNETDLKEDKSACLLIRLKRPDQPINLSKLLFPMVCSAFLRRIGFRWLETLPDGSNLSGYGKPWYSNKHRTKSHEKLMNDFITVCYEESLIDKVTA